VGEHDGYPFYTIGQRRGLGLALGERVYVTDIDPETNTITVGPKEELMEQTLTAHEINLVKYPRIEEERPAWGTIRYNDDGAGCLAWQPDDDTLKVAFAEPKRAITPGQSLVLYEDEDVLGGGWIHEVGSGDEETAEQTAPAHA
jgi:tRNA-specific 2-thiouridylase